MNGLHTISSASIALFPTGEPAAGTNAVPTTRTSTRKNLFVGFVFSVHAPAQEKVAIEQFLMHEAGGAISASHHTAQYIIVPRSLDAYWEAKKLDAKLGQKVIRLQWVQDALNRKDYVSRADYWGMPRPTTRPRRGSKAEDLHAILHCTETNINSTSSELNTRVNTSENAPDSSQRYIPSACVSLPTQSIPSDPRRKRGDTDSGSKPVQGPPAPNHRPLSVTTADRGQNDDPPWSLTSNHAGPLPTPLDEPPCSTSSNDVTSTTVPVPSPLLSTRSIPSHQSAKSSWGPVQEERWALLQRLVQKKAQTSAHPPTYEGPSLSSNKLDDDVYATPPGAGCAGPQSHPPIEPNFGVNTRFSHRTPTILSSPAIWTQSLKQIWRGDTFWVVGAYEARRNIEAKITARGGFKASFLAEATRVIFAGPVKPAYLRQTLRDYDKVQAINNNTGPCLAIAEGWIHDCHAAGETISWTPYRIINDSMFADREYWNQIGGGYQTSTLLSKEERDAEKDFSKGLPTSATTAQMTAQPSTADHNLIERSGTHVIRFKEPSGEPKSFVVGGSTFTSIEPKSQLSGPAKLTLIEEWRAARKPIPIDTEQEQAKKVGTPLATTDMRYPTPISPDTPATGSLAKRWKALASAFTKGKPNPIPSSEIEACPVQTTNSEPPPVVPHPLIEDDDLAGLFSSDEEDIHVPSHGSMDHANGQDIDAGAGSSEDEASSDRVDADNDDWEVLGVVLGSSRVESVTSAGADVKEELQSSRATSPLSSIDEEAAPRPRPIIRRPRRKVVTLPKIAAASKLGEPMSDKEEDQLLSEVEQDTSSEAPETEKENQARE
ncbi:hypothetical protein IAT40_002162 [Kwoniella sp. CBS 6097]